MNGLRVAAPVAFLLILSVSGTPQAFNVCHEPRKPACVSGFSKFASQSEFESCRSDMERYHRMLTLTLSA
jgi:hypothetical protein